MPITAGKYPAPNVYRWRSVLYSLYFFFPAVGLFVLLLLMPDGLPAGATVATSLSFGTACVLTVVSAIWFYFYRPRARYSVSGVEVLFEDLDYYVPETELQRVILQPAVNAFVAANMIAPGEGILCGIKLRLVRNRPRVPTTGEEKFGITWPNKMRSDVFAPYVLDYGTCGYEIRLLICHQLFPGRHEGDDIKWMKEHRIM